MAWRGGLSLSTSLGPHSKDAGEVCMAQGPLLGILHCQNPGRRSVQPSQPPSPGLGDNMLPDFCVAALWSNTFILITSILGSTHCLPAFPALPQHRGSAQDAGTCTAAPLPPLSCALHPRSPGDGGQGCAAQQLCLAPRRRHPSTTGTFTLLLTRRWPFLGWA